MSFLLGIGSWFMKNPMFLIIAAVASLIAFQNFQISSLKSENSKAKNEIAQIKVDQKATALNLDRIDLIQQQQSQTRNTQTIIRERIVNVPVKGIDRPFVDDPGLLDRADVMREHQRSYKETTTND